MTIKFYQFVKILDNYYDGKFDHTDFISCSELLLIHHNFNSRMKDYYEY